MITKLKYSDAKSIIKEVPTEGHSPLMVLADEYDTYFVKSGKGNVPAFDIINEYLCHYLLHFWSIPTPEISAVKVDPVLLEGRGFNPVFHNKHHYYQITFGSKKLNDTFELGYFNQINGKVDFRKYINPSIFVKIGLFDIWVENTDRKPSNFNILIQDYNSKLKIYAMDHAFTFNHMSYSDLNPDPNFITNTYNDNILDSTIVKEVIKRLKSSDWINDLLNYFYFCISECENNFINIVEQIPDELGLSKELVVSLQEFLFNKERNKAVFQEFLTRL
jgi:hypothetical protein